MSIIRVRAIQDFHFLPSMSAYCVELAKSGRSTCKRCKGKIDQDSLRIGKKMTLPGDIVSLAWNHYACVTIPKGSSVEYFIENLSGFTDLNAEDRAKIQEHFDALAGKRSPPTSKVQASPKKKAKTDGVKDDVVDLTVGNDAPQDEIFEIYNKMKIDELKDFMRWNKQMVGGNKTELVARCVDGHKYGALPVCPEADCGGKLKYTVDMNTVFCGGRYNEELGSRVPCYYKVDWVKRK